MKSGEKGLIGKGDNDYGHTYITPEIIDKIFKDANKNAYDKKVSKDISIHHLNQCKARMGKLKRKWTGDALREVVIMECMAIVDQKINKIKNG